MGLGINFDDPRYQKAILEAGAYDASASGKNVRGLVSDITSRFTGQQMGLKIQFARQAQAKKFHEDKIGLAHRRLRMEDKFFKEELKDEKKALNITSLVGLGTGLYSALEGQRRRKATEKLNQENKAWRDRVAKRFGI
jgi:hypothetical protein